MCKYVTLFILDCFYFLYMYVILCKFESCLQQRKTTCLLSIRISLACARASKLTTTKMYFVRNDEVNMFNQSFKCIFLYGSDCMSYQIDPSHKSHNAPDKYPTMHHFVTEMCTWDMAQMHSGILRWVYWQNRGTLLMGWCRGCDKPFPEPRRIASFTHISPPRSIHEQERNVTMLLGLNNIVYQFTPLE